MKKVKVFVAMAALSAAACMLMGCAALEDYRKHCQERPCDCRCELTRGAPW